MISTERRSPSHLLDTKIPPKKSPPEGLISMTVIIMLNLLTTRTNSTSSTHHHSTDSLNQQRKCNVNPTPPLTDINASITNHSPSTTQRINPQTPTINPNSPKLSLKKHHNQNLTPAKNSLTNQLTINDHQTSEHPPTTDSQSTTINF